MGAVSEGGRAARYRRFRLPSGMVLSVPDPGPELTYGTVYPPLPFLRFKAPGELWREAVTEASAALAAGGFLFSAGTAVLAGTWGCFRCALPPAPGADLFGIGAARIGGVRSCSRPAWQAGRLLAVFAV